MAAFFNDTYKVLRLNLSFAGRGSHFLSIGSGHASGVGSVGTVLRGGTLDHNNVAKFHSRSRPALALQQVRGTHFKTPIGNLAGVVFDIHVEPYVRICPIDLCDN